MATAKAYGSITVVDLLDISEFSVQPASNLPLTVVYDPDQNAFNPDWQTSNLILEPLIYYGGDALTLGTSGLTVSWERQEGIAAKTALVDGEAIVENGKLKVSKTKFTTSISMLTYLVTATYVEPDSGQTLIAKGQITFSLVKNASMAKTARITGDSIFKYDTSQTIVGASSITLTGKVDNVTISEWQYQNGSGDWVKYPGSTTSTTLTVNATDATFVNDKCVIKLATSDVTVFDLHTITKLKDGAAGTSTISAVLDNDDQMIPFDKDGVGDFSSAISKITIYEGGTNVTEQWTITQSYSNVTATASKSSGSHGSNNDTVTVTGISAPTGNVTFTCTKTGQNTITKTFSLVKVTAGVDGITPTIYEVTADNYALNKSISNTYTPATVTFRSYSKSSGSKTPYTGRFVIYENITYAEYRSGSTPTPAYTSTSDESSYVYTPSTSASTILCILFESGATTKVLDSQSVVITMDGQTGQTGPQGDAGKSAVNIILGDYHTGLNCTNSNTLLSQQTISFNFYAVEGSTRIPCSYTSVQFLGVNPHADSHASTASQEGLLKWVLPSGKAISNDTGTVSITFTATPSTGTPVSIVQTYTWSRITAAKDGSDAVNLSIFTPNGGNSFRNGLPANIVLDTNFVVGATTTTTGVTYQWYKWSGGAYTAISGQTAKSLTVLPTDIDSYASYKCTATYKTKPYDAYYSVFDFDDPIQVAVISSVGTQFVNGVGAGAIYVKVTQNGQEIDAMKSEQFLTSNPDTVPASGYYYKISEGTKSVTLMHYDGSSWETASDPYTGDYRWTWRDKDGNAITAVGGNTLPTQGKCIYLDGSMVDKKIIADVEVTI